MTSRRNMHRLPRTGTVRGTVCMRPVYRAREIQIESHAAGCETFASSPLRGLLAFGL